MYLWVAVRSGKGLILYPYPISHAIDAAVGREHFVAKPWITWHSQSPWSSMGERLSPDPSIPDATAEVGCFVACLTGGGKWSGLFTMYLTLNLMHLMTSTIKSFLSQVTDSLSRFFFGLFFSFFFIYTIAPSCLSETLLVKGEKYLNWKLNETRSFAVWELTLEWAKFKYN